MRHDVDQLLHRCLDRHGLLQGVVFHDGPDRPTVQEHHLMMLMLVLEVTTASTQRRGSDDTTQFVYFIVTGTSGAGAGCGAGIRGIPRWC